MAQGHRTPEELSNPEYNYFLCFGIDITETDDKKIEYKIMTKLGNVGGLIMRRRISELKDDIFEIMKDPVKRSKEAQAAKQFKLHEAVKLVEIVWRSRAGLFKSEFADICKTASRDGKFFTEQELFNAISSLPGSGIKIIDEDNPDFPIRDFRYSDNSLAFIGKKSLYEFLGLPMSASESEIDAKQADLYAEAMKSQDLRLKQTTSTQTRYIKDILLNAKKRVNYDRYLSLRESVWDEFELRHVNGIRELTYQEFKYYTDIAEKTLCISAYEAKAIIAAGCKEFSFKVVNSYTL